MSKYTDIIRSESEKLRHLHQQVHETFRARSTDKASWEKACEAFHSYVSPMDPMLHRVHEYPKYEDNELLEFVISFLELDPVFFRSGYIKEEMLRRLKRSPLSTKQQNRLRQVILQAVQRRGSREFRAYCRLAVRLADQAVIDALKTMLQSSDGSRKSRARLMLQYIEQDNAHNTAINSDA